MTSPRESPLHGHSGVRPLSYWQLRASSTAAGRCVAGPCMLRVLQRKLEFGERTSCCVCEIKMDLAETRRARRVAVAPRLGASARKDHRRPRAGVSTETARPPLVQGGELRSAQSCATHNPRHRTWSLHKGGSRPGRGVSRGVGPAGNTACALRRADRWVLGRRGDTLPGCDMLSVLQSENRWQP